MEFRSTFFIITILVACSAFFSGAEAAVMSLNKYKLRHFVKSKNRAAGRILKLLQRPDRLISMILVGNTFANIIASAVLARYAEKNFGEIGTIISTVALTVIILLFAEIIPKTIATLAPQKIAFSIGIYLSVMLGIFYPILWILNNITTLFFNIFKIKVKRKEVIEPLSNDEIYTVVDDSKNQLEPRKKNMLLGVLGLDSIKVSDVMVPYHQIEFINLKIKIQQIIKNIINAKHSVIVTAYNTIDNIAGVLPVQDALKLIATNQTVNYKHITSLLKEPYYIPSNLSVKNLLVNFQKKGRRFAIVVNEYGEIEGIVTVEDILEEIVGEFADTYNFAKHIKVDTDNTNITSGDTTIREINRHLNMSLPTAEAKTISGLIVHELKEIPLGKCCLKMNMCIIEVKKVEQNTIKKVKIKKF